MKIFFLSILSFIFGVQTLWAQTGMLDIPPKDKAEKFGANIVTTKDHEHSKISVSPDGKSIYWSFLKLPHLEGEERQIAYAKIENGKLGKREAAEFNSKYGSDSPNFWGNNKIIFHSRRNISTNSVDIVDDFWVVERQEDGWSEPKPLGFSKFPTIKKWAELGPLYCLPMPSVSDNGNIYFLDRNVSKSEYYWEIYVSYYQNGSYSEPVLLPENINTEHLDWEPFIAADESYLMFSSNRPGGYGGSDIYITFKKNNGTWSIPINMGDRINTEAGERFSSVSPDGKMLFFLRDFGKKDGEFIREYYWIDAGFIEELKPDELK